MPDLWGIPRDVQERAAKRLAGADRVFLEPLTTGLWRYFTTSDGTLHMLPESMVGPADYKEV